MSVSEGAINDPGLILIQIDGLSRQQMERAMQSGRLPFLRRLMKRENYELRTFYPGLPSSTPAVQAELFYGARGAVPAFSFLNREARRVFAMFDADCAREVETEISAKGDGLLHGGSSWSNIFTGGAATDESHFCASRLGAADTFRPRRIIQAITFPLLHFGSLARIVALTFAELSVALSDLCRGVYRGENFLMEWRTLISRLGVCVVLRELITIGVKIDAARGLPVIHANFLGYDEQSHRRGPSSAFAHWSLLGIDRAIRQIYRSARRSARRDYQVWIYSDHGQERTKLFKHDGKELDEIIRGLLEGFDPTKQPLRQRKKFIHRRAYISRKSGDRIIEGWQREIFGGDQEQWFSVAAMGPLGHLYLIHPKAQAQKLRLAERLVHEGRVPGVLTCNPTGIEWLRADRRITLPREATAFLPHPGSLKNEIARDLANLCRQKFAGDLVLLGWSPDQSPVTFVNEHGSHAGPGPEETQGFVLLPPSTKMPDTTAEFFRPTDLRAAALHFLKRRTLPLPLRVPKKNPHLRIMTYNVHGCRGMDGRISPQRIARVIERYSPDLVALQELDFGRVRSQQRDQARLIANELGMHVQFCPTVIDHSEQYGHAILSQRPMKIIRTATFENKVRRRHVEPRGALWVCLEFNDLKLNLMNTHFGLGRRERMEQAAELLGANWIGKISSGEPLILCGDFNLMPGTRAYHAISQRLRDAQSVNGFRPANTYSTFHPFARIDHIFVSEHFSVEKVSVPRNDLTRIASDHLPVIVDLKI
ncbi:MAG TPA: endonuclease/exonuclease/phosphatase family protein [Verrucomicrobiae bacterium]|nr:endonuclease/exonuclease/phosphatase family protein [Verrucomicrobiae bacterium]